mgnify:CR=1 FL=1
MWKQIEIAHEYNYECKEVSEMYNPINDRINNLMNQKQMIESQLQNIQQLANIPPININNQITPNMPLNDFNGKWVNNEQEAKNFANANLPTILFDNNKSIFYMKALDGTFKKFKFEEITEDNSNSIENRVNGIEKKLDDLICALSKPPKPAYITCSPYYAYNNGCGCNGYNNL